MRASSVLIVASWALALGACGSARDIESAQAAPQACATLATGATCPPASTLTYADFGHAFFSTYCTRCHSVNVTGDARNGAPPGVDFDTLDGIRPHACTIDAYAGSGPNGTNTFMPFDITATNPSPPEQFPTVGERAELSQWIACGLPP